ncbi:hypothetical protein M3Y97_00072100 [Aphelenchoides bicaudatus]|nr:hypothetical protein M3Y97_00072100 [Aphelenchoides bicaudatus]
MSTALMDHIDVVSYHCAPPEPTDEMTSSRQRLIDSVIRQKHSIGYRPTTSTVRKEPTRPTAPALHANQRVRQRSLSASKELPILRKDLKKAVAFGTTVTVKNGRSASRSRPSTSITSSSSQSNYRLQDDIQDLRIRMNNSEKIRREVDQLQKIVRNLIEENANLSGDLKQLSGIVNDLNESNSALMTRVNLLEIWHARANVEEVPRHYNNKHLKSKKSDSEDSFCASNFKNGVKSSKQLNGNYSMEVGRRLAHIYIGDEYPAQNSNRQATRSHEIDDESNRTSD